MDEWQEVMSKLTPHEQKVCEVIQKQPELTKRGIGSRLGISHHTVDFHLRKIYDKTGIHNKTALAANLSKASSTPT